MNSAVKKKGAIKIDLEGCKGCGICITSCPQKIIDFSGKLNTKGYNYPYVTNPDACTGCTNCAAVCPDGVIKVYREQSE